MPGTAGTSSVPRRAVLASGTRKFLLIWRHLQVGPPGRRPTRVGPWLGGNWRSEGDNAVPPASTTPGRWPRPRQRSQRPSSHLVVLPSLPKPLFLLFFSYLFSFCFNLLSYLFPVSLLSFLSNGPLRASLLPIYSIREFSFCLLLPALVLCTILNLKLEWL